MLEEPCSGHTDSLTSSDPCYTESTAPLDFPSSFECLAVQQMKPLRSKPKGGSKSRTNRDPLASWSWLTCSAGHRESLPEMGKESMGGNWHHSWSAYSQKLSCLFLVFKFSFHPAYGCRLGRAVAGKCSSCHLNQTVVWNPLHSWSAEKDLFLKGRMARVVGTAIPQAKSGGWGRVGQQEVSISAFV